MNETAKPINFTMSQFGHNNNSYNLFTECINMFYILSKIVDNTHATNKTKASAQFIN